jgi:AraC-like DNA-binding protein
MLREHVALTGPACWRRLPIHHDVIVDAASAAVLDALAQARRAASVCVRDLEAADAGADRLLSAASMIVLAARRPRGALADALVARVRGPNPHLTIFVHARSEDGPSSLTRRFALAGADALVVGDASDGLARVAARIRERAFAPAPSLVLRAMSEVLAEGEGKCIALWCLRNAYRKHSVSHVARWFGIDRKTASSRCRASGAAAPAALLRLGRLYHADELRTHWSLTQDEIARRLGFSNAAALVMLRARARRVELSLGAAPATVDAPVPWRRRRDLPRHAVHAGPPAAH